MTSYMWHCACDIWRVCILHLLLFVCPSLLCLTLHVTWLTSYHTSQFLLVCHSLLCIWRCILLPPISFHCTSIPPIFTSFHLLTPYFMLHVATTQLIFAIELLPFWRRKNTPSIFPFRQTQMPKPTPRSPFVGVQKNHLFHGCMQCLFWIMKN